MGAPNYTAADFSKALTALLPRGRVWPRGFSTIIGVLLDTFGPTYERQSQRAVGVLVDAFPSTTVELLPEWEESLGLPDPCAGIGATIEARRAQVVARFTSNGGQAIAYFVAFAANLGYAVAVKNYAPFRAGQSRAGDPLNSEDWFYTWAIIAPLHTINWFRASIGAAGEPLASWNNTVLECEMNTIKPAHSVLLFLYE